jgi:hypothetical protein
MKVRNIISSNLEFKIIIIIKNGPQVYQVVSFVRELKKYIFPSGVFAEYHCADMYKLIAIFFLSVSNCRPVFFFFQLQSQMEGILFVFL